jgi:hypothetical protein
MTTRRPIARGHRAVTSIAVLGLGALLAACSSGGSPSASSTSTTAQAVAAKTDPALARAELLPPSSFPAHWKAQGPSSENTGANFFGGMSPSDLSTLTSCLGIPMTNVVTNPAEAAGQEYDDPNSSVTVTDTVDVFPTLVDATTDAVAAASAKAPGCIQQLAVAKLSKGLPNGATVGQVTVTGGAGPAYGAHHADIVMSFPFTYKGVSGTEYFEVVLVQKGRSESVLELTSTGAPPPADRVVSLTEAAADRLQNS